MSHLEFPRECAEQLGELMLSGDPLADPKKLLCCSENVAHYFIQTYACECCDDEDTPPLIGEPAPADCTDEDIVAGLRSYDPDVKMGVPFWVKPLLKKALELALKALNVL